VSINPGLRDPSRACSSTFEPEAMSRNPEELSPAVAPGTFGDVRHD